MRKSIYTISIHIPKKRVSRHVHATIIPVVPEFTSEKMHREHGILFNTVQIQKNFSNAIFSSAKSIQLIKDNIGENDRFFLMDGTFRITPRGIFQQVLIIYAQFGVKVWIYLKN